MTVTDDELNKVAEFFERTCYLIGFGCIAGALLLLVLFLLWGT